MADPTQPVEPAPEAPETGFFEENPGEKSAMRLICILCAVAGIILCFVAAIAGLRGNTDTGTAVQMATTLLGMAFGGKVLQKFTEK